MFHLIPGVPGEFVRINEIPKAADWGDARRIEEIRSKLRAFEHVRAHYGETWERSYRRMREATGTNILDLFEIGRGKANRAS